MLCQFTVRNYKSIRDEITFDMQAAAISEHEDSIIETSDGEQYLPVSVIYGPNGGGKSTVLQAIQVLVNKVMLPIRVIGQQSAVVVTKKQATIEPFAFSEQNVNSATEFELFFRTKIAEYRYVLHIQSDNILFESLDRKKLGVGNKRKSSLFCRENGTIEMKGEFKKFNIGKEISDNLPVLSYLGITFSNNETVFDVLKWFGSGIQFINYGDPLREMTMQIANSPDTKKLVLQLLQELDIGIDDFRAEEDGDENVQVFMKHTVDGYSAELQIWEESSGTQKLFSMVPDIFFSLSYGNTLIIDELDAKLHPMLLRHIIEMYTNRSINRNGAQLVFTSHDLSTMNSEVFRRDEIWFVAKGVRQDSKLYSLVEFKNENGASVRKDAKFDKQYLEGKYGADPYLRRIIDWGEVHA